MFNRYKTDAPLTAGNALFLAERLGREHVSDNRLLFNMISNQLFGGYEEAIRQPIDNNWRRMPTAMQLIQAAENAFRQASDPLDEPRLRRLKDSMHSKTRAVLYSAVPKLEALVSDPSLIVGHMVVTSLMELRHRAVVAAGRQDKGIIRNFFADKEAEALHANFLKDVSNGDLTTAFSFVAYSLALDVGRGLYEGDLASDLISDAQNLITAARSLGGVDDKTVWNRLSEAEALIDDLQNTIIRQPTRTMHGGLAPR
jgi:hypothetical protein